MPTLPPAPAARCRVCNWLGHCPTLTPISLPLLDFGSRLAEGPLPCLLLGFWMQVRRRGPLGVRGGEGAGCQACGRTPCRASAA